MEDVRNSLQSLSQNDMVFYLAILGAFLFMNLWGFILVSVDKKRAIHGKWRIPEKNFFMIALIGGGVGVYAGMQMFRHKTKHLSFIIGIPVIIMLQIAIILWQII